MNHERIDVVLEACGVQDLHLELVRRFGSPHARAGGKNLHGIRADLMSVDRSAFERSASIGVNADAHPASIAGKRPSVRHSDIVKLASDAISPRIYWLPVAPIGE